MTTHTTQTTPNTKRPGTARTLAVFAAGALAIIGAACTPAQEELVRGVLQNVDSISGEVTITTDDGQTITIDLADIQVDTAADAVGSAALAPGDAVTLDLGADDTPTAIHALRAEVEGEITAIDATEQTITVVATNGVSETFNATPTTKFELDGHGHTFGDLAVGLLVEVKYEIESLNLVEVELDESERHGDDSDDNEAEGRITAIDPATHTVTVHDEDEGEATYTVVANTRIKGDHVHVFGDFSVGDKVEVKFNPTTLELIELELDGDGGHDEDGDENEGSEDHSGPGGGVLETDGVITAIGDHTVTIATENGIEVEYAILPDARFEGDNVHALSDFAVGNKVEVEFLRGTTDLVELKLDD